MPSLEHDRQHAEQEHQQGDEHRDGQARRRNQQHDRAEDPEADVNARYVAASPRVATAGAQLRDVLRSLSGAHCFMRRNRGRGTSFKASISQRSGWGAHTV